MIQEKFLLDIIDNTDTLSSQEEETIVEAFMDRYDVQYAEAVDIFNETKKWLWLAAKTSESSDLSLFIDNSLLVIDKMWHNFILHTKLYYKFCQSNFNKIIHHIPTPSKDKVRFKQTYSSNPRAAENLRKEATAKQLGIIYDELGPETLLKWYDNMAEKYTPEYLDSIKKA